MAHVRNRSLDVHLNLNVRGLKPSATVGINERCDAMRRDGRQIYKLGLGQSPFPVPRPVIEELRANAHQKAYLPVMGLDTLRDAVAEYYCRTQGISCTGENVLIGPGSKELMFLLQLVYYGDLVVPTPTWVSYAPQAHIIGRKVRFLPTTSDTAWRCSARDLAELCMEDPGRPRIVVLNYPANPTGATYKFDELQEIARVARKHRVVLLSDEIYGELHHKGQHVSIARFYPEGTIVSAGLSKWCGAGGWRLGTFTFPATMGWLRDAMAAVASETYTTTCAPIQYAAVRAFQGGLRIERYLWYSRKILGALGKWITRRLDDAGLEVDRPKGGFYVFPDFAPFRDKLRERGVTTSPELCEFILKDLGIALLPGAEFGRPAHELTTRIAYVDFDGARALAAAEVLPKDRPLDEAFLQTYCVQVVTAIERLCEWLHDK
jgi:aspartate aminotransferase